MYATGSIERSNPGVRWGWLYGITALMGGLLAVVEVAIPDGFARRTLELVVALAMLGAIALWVRLNRVGIALQNEGHPARPAPPAIAPERAMRKVAGRSR